MEFNMRPFVTRAFAVAFCALPLVAAEEDRQRLQASVDVLNEVMAAPDKGIPTDLFHKAHCVIVVPNTKKGGLIVSAKYGKGYATCRTASGWTAPAAMRVEGGGVGLQIGVSETDLIMLVMSATGERGLLSSKFTIGGEASAAAGPVGRDVTAQTDATFKADILSWSRSRGVFGGASLEGGTLRPDQDGNKELYGKASDNKEILTGKVKMPTEGRLFVDTVEKYGGPVEKSADRTSKK
jgi:lipid-binding SYLF domain-containing protein